MNSTESKSSVAFNELKIRENKQQKTSGHSYKMTQVANSMRRTDLNLDSQSAAKHQH